MTIVGEVVIFQVLLMHAIGRLKVNINIPPLSCEMSIFIHPDDLCNLKTGIPNLLRNVDMTTFLSKSALASSTAETVVVAIGVTHALASIGVSKTKEKIVDKIPWTDDSREIYKMVKDLHNHFCSGLKLKTKRNGKNEKGNGRESKSNGGEGNCNGNGHNNGNGDDHYDNSSFVDNGGSGGLLDQLAEIMKEMARNT